jgi:hypothetical protein
MLPEGQTVHFQNPQPSTFRIIEKIKEDNYQAEPEEIHDSTAKSSYCAAKYLYEESGPIIPEARVYEGLHASSLGRH